MKKVICILLMLALCLSLCACSFVTKQAVIGTWEENSSNVCLQYVIYKGGTGFAQIVLKDFPEEGPDRLGEFTWEIKDGVLLIRLPSSEIRSYQYDLWDDTLTRMDGEEVLTRVS